MKKEWLVKILSLGVVVLFIGAGVVSAFNVDSGNESKPLSGDINILEKALSGDGETEYWALLIAVGVYAGHPGEDRPSMLTEVEDLHEMLLVSTHWKEENIKVIKGENATVFNIIKGLRWLDKKDDNDDFSLVYITTHGFPLRFDIPPFDEEDRHDEALVSYRGFQNPFAIIWDDLLNLFLSLLNSKGVCVIIDSCYAGGFNDPPYFKNRVKNNMMNSNDWMQGFAEELSGNGRIVLMSCREDELSGCGKFTPLLIEAFRGYADTNEDDLVSAEEAFDYVVPLIWEEQHPTIYDGFTGELQLTEVELPPTKPETPIGQTLGETNATYNYSTVSIDPEGGKISYGWDWDSDYIVDEWTEPVDSNTTVNNSYSWTVEGTYNIRVIAKDEIGLLSDWSDPTIVIMCSDNIPDQWQRETDYGCWFYNTWCAQSFVPSLNTLSKVEIALQAYGPGDPKPLQFYIRNNLSGDNLTESSQDIPELGGDKWAWYSFDFENIDVIPGDTYYIVLKGRSDWTFGWKWKKGNPYTYGEQFESVDGKEWHYVDHYDPDGCFVTWGKI